MNEQENQTDTDDTAGNTLRIGKGVDDGVSNDDTEGNLIKGKLGVTDRIDADDVEGNVIRAGKALPNTTKPGRASIKVK